MSDSSSMMSIDPYLTPSPQSTTSLDPNLIRAILNPILPAVMRVEEGFQLTPYDTGDPYSADNVLPSLLKRLLGGKIYQEVEEDLTLLGKRLVEEIRPLSPLVHQASLKQYDHWGRRIDELSTSEGWRRLEEFAIEQGYVARAYERKYGELSRIHSFARVMVMTGDCHVIMCPMGMTDGAARTIELAGTPDMKRELLPKLTSRDIFSAYLSGQWMTERPGGSDVSQSETIATKTTPLSFDLGPPYLLNGLKWFSSAAEGNMAIALARTSSPAEAPGSRGLSLFVIPLRHGPYTTPLSNGVHMHRLKSKFGTHGVPTAELSLQDTRGWLIGELGRGVKTIVTVLNITRIHSAIHLVGSLQRCLAIAKSYAKVRSIDGGKILLSDAPLHVATLTDASILYRAITHVTFGVIELLGKSECGTATEAEESRLRLLTPAVKAYAAIRCPTAMEEMMGALGGLGYMEEVGIGRLIRDSLVERIWEGTINVLALDLVRATKNHAAVENYMTWADDIIQSSVDIPGLTNIRGTIGHLRDLVKALPHFFIQSATNPILPRPVLNYFASVSCALHLLQHAVWVVVHCEPSIAVDIESFRRWLDEGDVHVYAREIASVLAGDYRERSELNSEIVYGSKL